jgi:hypothetical protein
MAALTEGALTDDEIDSLLNLRDDVIVGIQNATPEQIMRTFEKLSMPVELLDSGLVRFSCRLPVEARVIGLGIL